MKKIVYILNLVTSVYSAYGMLPSLKDAVIFQYAQWTPDQREKFNQSHQHMGQIVLEDKNYHYLDLSNIKLHYVSFDNTHFNGVNLQGANLQGASFKGTTFKNSNLKEANLIGVKLEECCFKGASLQKAKLTLTLQLPDYEFPADIIKFYASLPESEDKKVLNQLIGTGSFDLRLQHLEGLDLTGINFKNCDLTCAYLQNTNLTNAQFENTTLRGANLSQVTLSPDFILTQQISAVDLIRLYAKETTTQNQKKLLNNILGSGFVNLSNTINNLNNINLKGINLSRSKLQLINLECTNLQGADLTDSKFKLCKLSGTTLPNGYKVPSYQNESDLVIYYHKSHNKKEKENLNYLFKLMPLQLVSCNLDNLRLSKINFSYFTLVGCSLKNTNFQGANLDHINVNLSISFNEAILPSGYKVPHYQNDAELVKIYGNSKDLKERESLNQFFDIINLDLGEEDFRDLDLSGIHLGRAELGNTDFRNSILTDAILDLEHRLYFYSAPSLYCFFEGATLWEGFTFPSHQSLEELVLKYRLSKNPQEKKDLNRLFQIFRVQLDKVDLSSLDLSKINFNGAQLREVDLTNADLTDALLNKTYFIQSKLGGVKLSKDFTLPKDVSLQQLFEIYADPTTTQKQKDLLNKIILCWKIDLERPIKRLNLKGLNLTGINLGTFFQFINLENTNLRKAEIKELTILEYQDPKDLIDFSQHSSARLDNLLVAAKLINFKK